jgi:hypothetical protein
MSRLTTMIAAAVASLTIVGLPSTPAQAAASTDTRAASSVTALRVADAQGGTAEASSTKSKDKKFVRLMASERNPDRHLYRNATRRQMHRLGVAVCGLIKAYDADRSRRDAIIDTLLYIEDGSDYPYTDDGDAWLVVSSINVYCRKYVPTLRNM